MLCFVRALPKPASTAVTTVQEMTKMSLLEMLAVTKLMHKSALAEQTDNHLLICK